MYEKQTWVNNTSQLNADRLNHMEQGILEAGLTVMGELTKVSAYISTLISLGNIINETGAFNTTYTNRASTCRCLKFESDIYISVNAPYQLKVFLYSRNNISASTFLSLYSNWTNDKVLIPANSYFALVIRKNDDANLNNAAALDAIRGNIKAEVSSSNIKSFIDKHPYIFNGVQDPKSLLVLGNYYSGANYIRPTLNRMTSATFLKFDKPVKISVKSSSYQIAVYVLSSDSFTASFVFALSVAFTSNEIVLQENTAFILRAQNANTSDIDQETLLNNIDFEFLSKETIKAYDYKGDRINLSYTKSYEYALIGTIPTSWSGSYKTPQDIEYLKDYAFVVSTGGFRAAKVDELYNTVQLEFPYTFSHANTFQFSPEYYDVADDYPLAYVSEWSNPATIKVVRLNNNHSVSLIKTYKFDQTKTGYYACACIDFDKNICYMIGYTENSTSDNTSGHNDLIISSFDLNNTIVDGDGNLVPAFIESFTLPFEPKSQGKKFLNGKIFNVSSTGSANGAYIYVIDPLLKKITSYIPLGGTLNSLEIEGIAFVPSNDKQNADIIVNDPSGRFYRVYLNN